MNDLEIAIERLTSWIREYGDNKPKVFVGDVSIILLAAKESSAREGLEKMTESSLSAPVSRPAESEKTTASEQRITVEVLDTLSDAEKVVVFGWAMDQDLTKEPFASIPICGDTDAKSRG